ncbi:uncharacterized protein N0V89_001485 [Didymosphaeria variabile]|uniref:Uncharacterized protein n=1 Tax=Didymosphaeria variabile TaxID=1932322 RepID=A0A9W8XX63_9PLEO|nr:uncharacterized protein N0V89_001485 [Didymosphaeria variabile]KAJ4360916.1 hypothetical protein N0V89_001485 [Didymosphaeria variabile]
MPASPAGSTAFFALALLTIAAAVLLLLRYYLPLRTTPAYVTVPVFLTIALPASIVLLVPIDLASSAGTKGIWLGEAVVYKSWRVTYWLTFVLSWAILPLLGEYVDSGYREPKARALYSVKSNGRYWAVMLGTGVLGLVYYIWYNGFDLENLKGTVMALAYAWSLALAIYLMGHGLVAFPRNLYRYASITGRLKRLQAQAPKLHEKLTESMDKLDQYEWQVVQLKQRKNATAREFQEWIDELAEKSSLPESRASVVGRMSTATVPPVITERYLADLTRKLKRARHAKVRFESEWDRLIHKAVKTQAILDSKASQRLEFKTSQFQAAKGGFMDRFTLLTPYTRYLLHVHVIPTLFYFAWILTSLASLAVVWSECIRSFVYDSKLSIIGRSVVHHPSSSRGQIGFGGQLIAAMWLCYMLTCSFFSLTEVKIWGNRALVRRNTYQESATWYSLQLAKLTVPLSYNFVTFMPRGPIVHETSFFKLLGQYVESTPVGQKFSDYFPIFILVPVLATAFGLYKKVKNISGFGDLLEDEEDEAVEAAGTGGWREGRALIEREIQSSSNNGSLGLAQRNASPNGERYSDNPPLAANAEPSSRRQPLGRRRPPVDDEEEGGNFFENFSARVKNTFETRDWNFERPRWLGGEDEVDRGQRTRGSGDGGERGGGFLGLFGGRSEEGRLRL